MEKMNFYPQVRKILADTVTPVSVYLRLRTLYPKSILLESSDYHGWKALTTMDMKMHTPLSVSIRLPAFRPTMGL